MARKPGFALSFDPEVKSRATDLGHWSEEAESPDHRWRGSDLLKVASAADVKGHFGAYLEASLGPLDAVQDTERPVCAELDHTFVCCTSGAPEERGRAAHWPAYCARSG
jgi:hypothetical protein